MCTTSAAIKPNAGHIHRWQRIVFIYSFGDAFLSLFFVDPPDMTGVALLPVELASVVIETLLFGVCLVLFSVAIYVLIVKRGLAQASRTSTTRSNQLWFGVAVTLTCAAFAVRNLPW